MAAAKFEIFRDDQGEHRFRLVAPNGEIIAQSEGYSSDDKAHEGIEAVQQYAAGAAVVTVE